MLDDILDNVITGFWWTGLLALGFLVYPTAVSAGWVKDDYVMRHVVLPLRTPARRWLAKRTARRGGR